MTADREFGYAPVSNHPILPNWRVILSAWLVVGFLVLMAIGIHATASRFAFSNDSAAAQLVIPRHDPSCGAGVPQAASDCSGVDPALVMRYSPF